MWWWGNQEAHGATGFVADSVKKYEAAHPNIKIVTKLQSTDGLVPAFQAAAAAKKGPDIEYFWGGINTLEDGWAGNITPISTLLPQSEWKHYINGGEDTSGGKLYTAPWYLQPSFPILYRKDVLKNAGIAAAPTTWSQLLADCKTLRAKGITPMAGGIKDGWFGGWLYSLLGSQTVKSIDDVKAAVVGTKKFTDPELAAWWTRLEQMKTANCWNDDIGSLGLYQAQATWVDGKSAMTITAGTDVKKFVKPGRPVEGRCDGDADLREWRRRRQARRHIADARRHVVLEVPEGGGGVHRVPPHARTVSPRSTRPPARCRQMTVSTPA